MQNTVHRCVFHHCISLHVIYLFLQLSTSDNMFDDLLTERPHATLRHELKDYLSKEPDPTVRDSDVLAWWYQHQGTFPRLYHMALNYHSILGKFLHPIFCYLC